MNSEIWLPAAAGFIPVSVAPLSSMKLDSGGVKMAEDKFFAAADVSDRADLCRIRPPKITAELPTR
jgi:hypothetical protein